MPESEYTQLTAIELERIAPLSEAARLAGVSKDTLQRHHADKILKLSPRRLGMRVRDALDVSASASNSTKIVSPEKLRKFRPNKLVQPDRACLCEKLEE